jgi:hypothetical protein
MKEWIQAEEAPMKNWVIWRVVRDRFIKTGTLMPKAVMV